MVGIIPACAGNTIDRADGHSADRDHPRVCGEHASGSGSFFGGSGSSPRVRGTPHVHEPPSCVCGIIPACAGNTWKFRRSKGYFRDHPRVCGEHFNAVRSATSPQGSSPRVRGTLLPSRWSTISHGIIPACAGNTVSAISSLPPNRDHPRVCGEHRFVRPSVVSGSGSSPRVRGTPAVARRARSGTGIIPACAGNTGLARS